LSQPAITVEEIGSFLSTPFQFQHPQFLTFDIFKKDISLVCKSRWLDGVVNLTIGLVLVL